MHTHPLLVLNRDDTLMAQLLEAISREITTGVFAHMMTNGEIGNVHAEGVLLKFSLTEVAGMEHLKPSLSIVNGELCAQGMQIYMPFLRAIQERQIYGKRIQQLIYLPAAIQALLQEKLFMNTKHKDTILKFIEKHVEMLSRILGRSLDSLSCSHGHSVRAEYTFACQDYLFSPLYMPYTSDQTCVLSCIRKVEHMDIVTFYTYAIWSSLRPLESIFKREGGYEDVELARLDGSDLTALVWHAERLVSLSGPVRTANEITRRMRKEDPDRIIPYIPERFRTPPSLYGRTKSIQFGVVPYVLNNQHLKASDNRRKRTIFAMSASLLAAKSIDLAHEFISAKYAAIGNLQVIRGDRNRDIPITKELLNENREDIGMFTEIDFGSIADLVGHEANALLDNLAQLLLDLYESGTKLYMCNRTAGGKAFFKTTPMPTNLDMANEARYDPFNFNVLRRNSPRIQGVTKTRLWYGRVTKIRKYKSVHQ
jgi:hypothetical protein